MSGELGEALREDAEDIEAGAAGEAERAAHRAEALVMRKLVGLLSTLDAGGRRRTLRYLFDFYGRASND